MRRDLAVKWLSLVSIKSEQVIKMCSTVNLSYHPMHTGGSSALNKRSEWWKNGQGSAAVWKSRWPSWAPVPNKPTVSADVKQQLNWTKEEEEEAREGAKGETEEEEEEEASEQHGTVQRTRQRGATAGDPQGWGQRRRSASS